MASSNVEIDLKKNQPEHKYSVTFVMKVGTIMIIIILTNNQT